MGIQIWEKIEKECPICETIFETRKGHPREKTTCGYSCSNTYFRSGENNPNWKEKRYRTTCFIYHKKKCIICEENKIVEVHHFDENKNNNTPENLIPLCPTHHKYRHSRFKKEVNKYINEYRKLYLKNKHIWLLSNKTFLWKYPMKIDKK